MTDPSESPAPPDVEITPAQPSPSPPNGNGQQPDTISERVQRAREIIPVGDRGLAPANYAQWIDIAKDVCRAYLMLPEHLHNNAPVMAGILEIAARFNLSAYMLASKTYVQNKRLCFEAQAFAAILYASKLLKGRLRFDFHGEGMDRTCTVSGIFKDDPDTILMATTPPLGEIHPGHVQKDGKTFVKGSPLWDKDVEQQISYYAERRWIRRFAPDVCMGMYAPDEIAEIDRYRADSQGAIPLEADRLGQLDTGEGWREGRHVERDLAAVAEAEDWPIEAVTVEPEPEPEPERPRPARRKAMERRKPVGRPMAAPPSPPPRKPAAKTARPVGRRRAKPPPPAVIKRIARRAERPPQKVVTRGPRWLDYVQQAETWIHAASDPDAAEKRWDDERDQRDDLQVPMGERSRLRAILDRRIAKLRPKPEG